MKLIHIFLVITGTLFICSCSKELNTSSVLNDFQKEGFSISIEDALSSLENFLIENGKVETKGGLNNYIDGFFTVSGSGADTKGTVSNQSVLYAVNFKDEQGYALLSADKRIPEDIIAITDAGNVQEKDFFTDENLTPTENDDLSVEEYNEMVSSGALAAIQMKQVNIQCKTYAEAKIVSGGGSSYSGSGQSSSSSSTPETYEWKVVKEVPRMLNTVWTQSTEPFNKYCPEVGLIWKTKAPSGCVCIALSQIIAYHEYPANLTCNGMKVNYPEIKKIYSYDYSYYTGTETSKEMLARFCINVGGWCYTKYHSIFGNSWGFAWPSDAKSCLETFGYRNVSLDWGYDENKVLESLDSGCPVFMSAIAGLWSGHAWVIDGYMKRNYVSNKGSVKQSQTLVHCNWGWHGDCNGYFTSGVFHTQDAEIQDTGFSSSMSENYWYAFNTITYEKP